MYAKTAIRIVHTHAHTHARVDGRGADTHRWGGGCFSLSPGMAVSLRLPHSKKFELFLNFSSKYLSQIVKICYFCIKKKKKLGRRLLLLLLILFFLVLLLLLEEGRRPQPLLLLLRAQRGLWIRGTARITLALKRKVENEKINFYSDMDEIDEEKKTWMKVRMVTSENVRFPSVSSSPYVCSPANKDG